MVDFRKDGHIYMYLATVDLPLGIDKKIIEILCDIYRITYETFVAGNFWWISQIFMPT